MTFSGGRKTDPASCHTGKQVVEPLDIQMWIFWVVLLILLWIDLGLCLRGVKLGCRARRDFSAQMHQGYTAVMVVPTGIGAAIGGYAGDALPSAKLLSSIADTLITHPNVMNGAMLYWSIPNILYVEGYALDEFASGSVGLIPVGPNGNRVGLLLDKGMEEDLLVRHMQVADAFRATLGINVAAAVVTSEPIGVKTFVAPSGASWGSVENTRTLLDGARALVDRGCDAIAVVARFPEDEDEDNCKGDEIENSVLREGSGGNAQSQQQLFQAYREGQGVDAIAGAEALISHVITKHLFLPCAHAPAFAPSDLFAGTNPKACAEELGYTFLPCVLAYLHTAPRLLPLDQGTGSRAGGGAAGGAGAIVAADVDCVIAPASALGGPAVLSFLAQPNTLVLAVEENSCTMQADAFALLGPGADRVVKARSYAEAAGLMAAHKAGILLSALTKAVPRLEAEKL